MRAHSLLLVLLGGCTWVSEADYQARLPDVDDDGDGFIGKRDCDDSDATISPGAEEVWYDGIDGDCAKDDDYDQDGDGYVATEYFGLTTKGAPNTGSLPGGDCDDTEVTVNPEAPDEWYDGVNTDCAGNDDYDQDGDGYVALNAEGSPTQYVEGSGALDGGDCDDEKAGVNPAAEDVFYDGIDTDCAGNDDYDQDGDGHVPPEHLSLTTTYVPDSGGLPADDCDDRGPPETDPDADPLGFPYNPDATETWYDGVDADCAGDDDFDQDADGYADANRAYGETTQADVPIDDSMSLEASDCDDSDPEVNAYATEVVTDSLDRDCDGDSGTFVMADLAEAGSSIHELRWTNPDDLVWDANSTDVFLSIRTPEVGVTRFLGGSPGSESIYYESAFAFGISRDDPGGGILTIADWWRFTGSAAPYTLTDGHDFIAEDDALYGLIGLQLSTGRVLRVSALPLPVGSASRVGPNSRLYIDGEADFADFEHLSLDLDSSGVLHAIGTESTDGVLHYARGAKASILDSTFDEQELYTDQHLGVCAIDAAGRFVAMGESTAGAPQLETWTFDPGGSPPALTLADTTTYDAVNLELLTYGSNQWTVVADGNGGGNLVIINASGVPTTIAAVGTPVSLHAVFVHGGTALPDMVLTYANDLGEAWFVRYNTGTGAYTEQELATDLLATDAAVWIDTEPTTGDEYLLAAVASSNAVHYGWAWY